MASRLKTVKKVLQAPESREGDGFLVRRPIAALPSAEADPYLMLDELGPTNYAPGEFHGAPWHPHRGFDTVTYIKAGEATHHDSMGNSGMLRSGDCQWMTAGSGLIHDEGKDHPGGLLHVFQMWVNLPRSHKMDPPKYQDIPAAKIPVVDAMPGVRVKIIAGESHGVKAVITPVVPVQYIDFMLSPGATATHTVPPHMDTVLAYVYRGKGSMGGTTVTAGHLAVLSSSGAVVSASADGAGEGMDFLLLAGKKIGEPVAWRGPFVMNTEAEVEQAFEDYRNGRLCKHKPVPVL